MTPWTVAARLLCPWGFSWQEYWSGLPCPPPGIFSSQGSNPGLPHYRQILYQLSHQESPRILEWVAFPFSRGSSLPRNQTGVSCIAGGFFTNWPKKPHTEKCTSVCTYEPLKCFLVWGTMSAPPPCFLSNSRFSVLACNELSWDDVCIYLPHPPNNEQRLCLLPLYFQYLARRHSTMVDLRQSQCIECVEDSE